MINIFYSKSKNQFIKSTKFEKGKVSTEIVSYDKLKDYKDIIIIKNSFNFDANLEAYKDVFEIDTNDVLSAHASACYWDMIEYNEAADKKFNQISAGTKLTDAQKNKSIITVNELMKVKHADDECEMIPLMKKMDNANPENIENIKITLDECSEKDILHYIEFLETFYKDKFSDEFWDEIEKCVEEIRKEIAKTLFQDDELKNKKEEISEENKPEESNVEEGVNDDTCNSQFTGVTEEDLNEIQDSKKERKWKKLEYSAPDFGKILPTEEQRNAYKQGMESIRKEIDDIHRYQSLDENTSKEKTYAEKLKDIKEKHNFKLEYAIKTSKHIFDNLLSGIAMGGVDLEKGYVKITSVDAINSVMDDEMTKYDYVSQIKTKFGFNSVEYYPKSDSNEKGFIVLYF